MTTHYFTHTHAANIPLAKCMLSSVRRFHPDSPITAVLGDGAEKVPHEFTEWTSSLFSMSAVASLCAEIGIDWDKAFAGRSPRERSWAMQACLPYFMLKNCEADWFVYLDSDVYFFNSLYLGFEESVHVAICKHHYPKGQENVSAGVYNNGLLAFRNSDISREHMKRWATETIERWQPGHPREIPHEQKLLDEWPEQLGEALSEFSPNIDCGPWRLAEIACMHPTAHFPILKVDGHPNGAVPLQSWHMHELRLDANGNNPVTIKGRQCNRTNYTLHPETIESVYVPYETELAKYL